MERTTLFIGLTREVTFAGLPMMYMVILIMGCMLGFFVSGSFIVLIVSGMTGYTALRGLAAYDPKLLDLLIATLRCTRMEPGLFSKQGVIYRA